MSTRDAGVFVIEDPHGTRRVTAIDFPLSLGGARSDVQLLPGDAARTFAHLGLAGDDLFVQAVETSGRAIRVNDAPLSGSRWLRPGDELRVDGSRLRVEASAGKIRLIAEPDSPDHLAAPVLTPPPREGDLSRLGDLIEPVAFTPRITGSGLTPRNRLASPGRYLALGLAVLALVAVGALLYSAQAIEIAVQPTPDLLRLDGGLNFVVAGRHVLLSGSYTLVAEKSGYTRLETPLVVAADGNEPFFFRLELLPGLLEISTGELVGADILIDGELAGRTPLERPIEVAAGEHELRLSAPRHQDFVEHLTIEGAGALQSIVARLEPRWAPVQMSSDPAGASVRVDGRSLGTTPLTLELGAGSHRLELSLAGYQAYTAAFPVVAGRPVTLPRVRLAPLAGIVQLASVPPGAAVTVDGAFEGETPLELVLAPDRAFEIKLSRAGFATASLALQVKSDERREMTVELDAQLGKVVVSAWPPDAQLSIDGEPRGHASQTLMLPTTPHLFEIRKAGFEAFSQTVTPILELTHSLEVRLRTFEELETLAMPPTYNTAEGHELRLIAPGRFRLGAPRREPGRGSNEVIREVDLTRRFYVGAHEITNRQFRRFRQEHLSGNVAGRSLETDHHPVVNVSWQDAAAYCNWLSEKEQLPPAYVRRSGTLVAARPRSTGYRLPTEAEWSWVARFADDGASIKYPWGDSLPVADGSGNYADASARAIVANVLTDFSDGFPTTAPVDAFRPNARGLFNLGGNAAEWTHDFYGVGVSREVLTDPWGPESGRHHVIRGSSWRHSTITELRLTYRDFGTGARPDVGFRLARYAE
ncbi:MAG: SUMF1/EgtB/PvdO family nonheme iron enzyme [Acidobacteria bacterium]|nr:SUMF1/EgtB/PvdO family nonheme iron enzyme [Acidobacteriota bacterium]